MTHNHSPATSNSVLSLFSLLLLPWWGFGPLICLSCSVCMCTHMLAWYPDCSLSLSRMRIALSCVYRSTVKSLKFCIWGEEGVRKQPWTANLQVNKRPWCLTEEMTLPCLSPKVSLSENIFRLKRMKELKGYFCIFFSGTSCRKTWQEYVHMGERMKLLGRTTKESGVTFFLIEVSWLSQIFPVLAQLFSVTFSPYRQKITLILVF